MRKAHALKVPNKAYEYRSYHRNDNYVNNIYNVNVMKCILHFCKLFSYGKAFSVYLIRKMPIRDLFELLNVKLNYKTLRVP